MVDEPMAGAAAEDPDEEWRRRCAQTKGQVEALLQKQQRQEALAEALRDPPYAPTAGEVRESFRQVQELAAQVVVKALAAFKEADVREAVAKLGEEEQTALMKYLYRLWGSGQPPRTNAQLFSWHAALVEHAGEGSICRAMYDWRRRPWALTAPRSSPREAQGENAVRLLTAGCLAAPMGNTGWRADEPREVVICLHSVHNVQHSPNESYYGMATDHASEVEIPVTSERPARLMAGIDSVLSVRVFLHNRGSPSSSDRPVGQLSIPVRELLDSCGPGLYQTWFLLDAPTPYGGMQRSHVVERFRRALHGVALELHTSRICLTVLESSTEPADWHKVERDRIVYYEPLLTSHQQHVQITQAYFDYVERLDSAAGRRSPSKKPTGGGLSQQAPVEASALKAELERLQFQQREEEVVLLQRELDQITEEANKRIEKGNSAIVKLKAELKHLRDVEAVQLQREQEEAEQRIRDLRREGEELRKRAESTEDDATSDAELEKLKADVLVLTNQKDALMKMVQDVYGTAQAPGSNESNAQAAAALALASIQGPQSGGNRECKAEEKLLPDAHELLNEPLRPLG